MQDLLTFLRNSPTQFHAAAQAAAELESAGYARLFEHDKWEPIPGGKYYVMRNDSAVLAFRIPTDDFSGFMISASHSDSPTFRIKENAEIAQPDGYVRLNVERYGGMLCAPWLDRPLTAGGRVLVQNGNTVETRLVYVDRDLLLIPNVAIHMNREANSGYAYDCKTDMIPLMGIGSPKGSFRAIVAEAAGCRPEDILGQDLFLCMREHGFVWGAQNEFISSPRLDDLQCAYGCLGGFLTSGKSGNIPVYALFDNEEIGSLTRQGADGTFLSDLIDRICEALGRSRAMMLADSFLVSADNAHAVHPNHPEYCDATHRPVMNGGIVIKHGVRYATDGAAQAVFTAICKKAGVPVQHFSNRSDLAGGSTLGNISGAHVSVSTVDIGLAQLAMHSPMETAGARDADYLIRAMKEFYQTTLRESDGSFHLDTL